MFKGLRESYYGPNVPDPVISVGHSSPWGIQVMCDVIGIFTDSVADRSVKLTAVPSVGLSYPSVLRLIGTMIASAKKTHYRPTDYVYRIMRHEPCKWTGEDAEGELTIKGEAGQLYLLDCRTSQQSGRRNRRQLTLRNEELLLVLKQWSVP